MANNLDRIVTVNIDIAAPAIDAANFDNLLIFGPAPKIPPSRPLPPVGIYSDLAEVTGAGYAAVGESADPVGIAARIAFSQNPRPTQIFIAAMGAAPPSIKNADIKIITADNYLTDAVGADPAAPLPTDLPWLQIEYSRKAVTTMQVEIEKDGALVFANELPNTKNKEAFLQVTLGDATDPQGDQMNLPASNWAGVYTVTLTATQGVRVTTLVGTVTFDGTSSFTAGLIAETIVPETLTPVETLALAIETPGWYVACPAGIPESQYESCAELTEANTKLFAYTFLSEEDPVPSIYFRSHGWCGLENDDQEPEDVPVSNHNIAVAATARCLSFPAGSETWAFKRLAGVLPSNLSTTVLSQLQSGHSNWFARHAGRNITMNGQVRSGEWIDVVRGRDWLQNDMQLRIFNLMLMRPKIPYTNPGIALVENQMRASLLAAQDRGIVAPDEYDGDGILVPGFVVSVPNAATITPTQRASRVLVDCKFTARIAGAIHAVRVDGVLTYEFFIAA